MLRGVPRVTLERVLEGDPHIMITRTPLTAVIIAVRNNRLVVDALLLIDVAA